MKIVKPTLSPTMAVVVDTLFDETTIAVGPADHLKARIDTVFVRTEPDGSQFVGIRWGTPHATAPAPPALFTGERALAHLHIARHQTSIADIHIAEVLK
jgi:hypothetical protein